MLYFGLKIDSTKHLPGAIVTDLPKQYEPHVFNAGIAAIPPIYL